MALLGTPQQDAAFSLREAENSAILGQIKLMRHTRAVDKFR